MMKTIGVSATIYGGLRNFHPRGNLTTLDNDAVTLSHLTLYSSYQCAASGQKSGLNIIAVAVVKTQLHKMTFRNSVRPFPKLTFGMH